MRVMGVLSAVLLASYAGMALAQDVSPASGAAAQAAPAGRAAEAPIDGLVRKDPYTVALTLPGKHMAHGVDAGPDLLLNDFEFEGQPVMTDKLHFKQLAPGVVEITSLAYSVGDWRFRVRDAGNYYGLGERFDTLNHSHTIVMNSSQDNAGCEGIVDLSADPVFHEHDGLWALAGYDV